MTRSRAAAPEVQNEAAPESPPAFHGEGGCYRMVDGVRVKDESYENAGRTKVPGPRECVTEKPKDEVGQPAAE